MLRGPAHAQPALIREGAFRTLIVVLAQRGARRMLFEEVLRVTLGKERTHGKAELLVLVAE